MRHAFKILVGKPEGKRSLGKPRHRWEVNSRFVAIFKGNKEKVRELK
jgi:hypothetical protein